MPEGAGTGVGALLFPDAYADESPGRPAYVMAESGEAVSYGQLVDRSRRAAHLLRELGARRGDCVAILLDPRFPAARCG